MRVSIIFDGDEVHQAVVAALEALDAGSVPEERQRVDFKEEAGRRDRDGAILPGATTNEVAVEKLAGEVACMSNTPGGGALILGVADDGTVIGTDLDQE